MKKIKELSILFALLLIYILAGCEASNVELKENEVQVLKTDAQFTGSHYEDVVKELEAWGFTNIETVPVYDIIFNITQPGTIKEIIIDGSNSYHSGDIFNHDVPIVIKYSMPDHEDPEKESYTVTWKNEDGTVLEIDENLIIGTIPTYDSDFPIKAETAEFSYEFSGWNQEVTAVTQDQEYTAVFTETKKTYTITWINDDGEILEVDDHVEYGTIPTYDGEIPSKAETAKASYEFVEWDLEITAVDKNVTYKAVYKETIKTYTITWENEDGSLLKTDEVLWGTVPEYIGSSPTKEGTDQLTYTFNGWTPEIKKVTEDQVYKAIYEQSINTFIVTWSIEEDVILETDLNVEYGTIPTYDGEIPTKDETAEFSYEFAGWDQEISAVTKNTDYIAIFTETIKTYTITWENVDGEILEVDQDVLYGSMPTYDSELPTKTNTAEFSYEFEDWTPIIELVTKDQVYQAIITETINRYTISIDPNGGELENTEINFDYGTTFYSLAEPKKLGFVFTGWQIEEEALAFPYTLVDHIQITAIYREMEAHELLWDYYTEVTDNPDIIANHEEGYVEILGEDSNGRAIYNKNGLYGLYYDLDGYQFIVVIDLINSMIYYTDEYDWYYERDFLFTTYEGNVSMDDYLFIEDLFKGALDGLTEGIFVTISDTYNKTIDFSVFNENWTYLSSLPENHYKTYEMLVMESMGLTIYDFELSFSGNYVYYYFYIKNNSDEVVTYLKINLEFVMHAIYGTSTTYTTNTYWTGTLNPGETTSDYVIIETSYLFTKTVDGSSASYTGLYTDIYLSTIDIMY